MGVLRRDELDGCRGHVAQHAGAPHDAREGAGGHQDARHQERRGSMRIDPGPLNGGAVVVDDQGQGNPDHETHDGFHLSADHRSHQDDRKGEVDPEVPGSSDLLLHFRQFAMDGRVAHLAARQAEALDSRQPSQ